MRFRFTAATIVAAFVAVCRPTAEISLAHLFVILGLLVDPSNAGAQDRSVTVNRIDIERLAERLVREALEANMLEDSCRLYLADRESAVGALVSQPSYNALRDAMLFELLLAKPAHNCEVMIMETTGRLDQSELDDVQQGMDLPGAFYSLGFIPSSDGVMLFATGYSVSGRNAVFTGRIDVAIENAGEWDQAGEQGLGGPTVSIPTPDHQIKVGRSLPLAEDSDSLERPQKQERTFLDRLRDRAGTERAE